MTPRELRNIQTTGNSCRDTLPCANMALKLPQYFYLLMEKPLGCYFQVRSLYYQEGQCNQKTPIPISSRWQVGFLSLAKHPAGFSLMRGASPLFYNFLILHQRRCPHKALTPLMQNKPLSIEKWGTLQNNESLKKNPYLENYH